jgi:hypothetical protein
MPFQYAATGRRDLRIDWLRGLAMTCVIVDHSKLTSLLSWFSYQRFWIVTAAEVFVVLSGVVLGTVYSGKLERDGWRAVVRGLTRRALTLYFAFLAVTLSVLVIALAGVDVSIVAAWDPNHMTWFMDPRSMNADAWRDLALMRYGPWPFEIVGLYVWLVVAAIPCLLAARAIGWRPLLAASWIVYGFYRLTSHSLTAAEFEVVFPILAWQLLFVHGLAIGCHRERIAGWVERCPAYVPAIVGTAAAAFAVLALCNPWMDGPQWLRWTLVSPERFAELYERYFTLNDLGIGRLMNVAVALPIPYLLLTWCWAIARPFNILFVTLGQKSLGAFVLHVYGILLIQHLPFSDAFWANTIAQVLLIAAIAALLHGARIVRRRPLTVVTPHRRPLPA